MKKSTKIGAGVALMALTGYGAWMLYDKVLKKEMPDMECMFKNVSKDVEKSLDDMM